MVKISNSNAQRIITNIKESSSNSNNTDSTTISTKDAISNRQTKEIVIGLCGTVGSGIKSVVDILENELDELGYKVYRIRVSQIMTDVFEKFLKSFKPIEKSKNEAANRYIYLQEVGNYLREKFSNSVLSEAAIREIKFEKTKNKKNDNDNDNDNEKTAWLIDQLKHPEEVELLRLVYQHNFYLLGVLRTTNERKINLQNEGISKKDSDLIIHLDRKNEKKFGQQTENTILDSDYFIINKQGQKKLITNKINRFLNIIHGVNGNTPTFDEKSMFAAYATSLQSSCLSRQVGAAIADDRGNIISLGKNDVPRFGGGLYSYDDNMQDYRCIHKNGKCSNDIRKLKIKNDILNILTNQIEEEKLTDQFRENLSKITDKIYKDTAISSIIEYSRSIHAEMDAIVTLARLDNSTCLDKILYTTTFPCHNCARHIIAAGIKKVIYIEPYEKSLAFELHDDAITDINECNKVSFEAFEGVSPRRYQKFFLITGERKNEEGIATKYNTDNHSYTIDKQFRDSYTDYETKVVTLLTDKMK